MEKSPIPLGNRMLFSIPDDLVHLITATHVSGMMKFRILSLMSFNFQVIAGNSDTQSSVLRALDGGIVARNVRIIPVSELTRTVCMRVELYGCSYKGFETFQIIHEFATQHKFESTYSVKFKVNVCGKGWCVPEAT